MTPEEKARVKIDQWFADAGWKVVNRDEYEPTISAVAIREGLLKGNLEADYFLFINGKAVGVLEAKREEINISSNIVSEQAITYAKSVPDCYQAWQKPLPFLFKSNGKEIEFFDYRHRETSEWETISRILTPKGNSKDVRYRRPFAGLPTLNKKGLRECQYEAVTELEKSFRIGQNRALMVLATGAGENIYGMSYWPIVCLAILLCVVFCFLLTAITSENRQKQSLAHSALRKLVMPSIPSMQSTG